MRDVSVVEKLKLQFTRTQLGIHTYVPIAIYFISLYYYYLFIIIFYFPFFRPTNENIPTVAV